MIFKKNNPGCPCCNCPCACYKFDDNANDSMGSHDLTATNATYGTGKLDNALRCQGTQALEHEFDPCFSVGSGINVWFWAKREIDTPYGSSGASSKGWGTIAGDGSWPNPDGNAFIGANETGYTGSWFMGINIDSKQTDPSLRFLIFAETGNIEACHGQQLNPFGTVGWHFYFWWWDILNVAGEPIRKSYLIHNDDAVDEHVPPVVGGASYRTKATSETVNFNVATNLAKGFDDGGTQYMTGDVYIDNLGICKNIGTKAEMTARAAALYNSGNGLACNNSGK